jgi:hypothetical protein
MASLYVTRLKPSCIADWYFGTSGVTYAQLSALTHWVGGRSGLESKYDDNDSIGQTR